VVETGEDSDLVKSILLLFVTEIKHLNFLEGIDLVIFLTSHLINRGVGSIS
jgi:hypothetical protein